MAPRRALRKKTTEQRLHRRELLLKRISRRTAKWLHPLIGAEEPYGLRGADPESVAQMAGSKTHLGRGNEGTNAIGDHISITRKHSRNAKIPGGVPLSTPESMIVHELTHAMRGKNHYMAANAFEVYVRLKRALRQGGANKQFLAPTAKVADINSLIELGTRLKIDESLDKKIAEHGTEFGELRGISLGKAGLELAKLAVREERRMRRPGIGLYLIREVINGKPIAAAIKELERGEHDAQLAALLQANPRLRKITK